MKKVLSLIMTVALVLSLFVCFTTASAAPGDTVLTIYTQNGATGTPVLAKSYTEAQLQALADSGEYGYQFYKSPSWQAVVATEYVTLNTLFGPTVSFDANDYLKFTCSDGAYTKAYPTYEQVTASQYYIDDSGSTTVPAGIALTWGSGSLATSTISDIAATAVNTGSLRFVYGITQSEYDNLTAVGKRMPSGVISITIVQQ